MKTSLQTGQSRSAYQPRLVDPQAGTAVLSSWKEIAHYVGRGVRTVQRWEKELGLPVRRPHSNIKSAVLAFPHEINQWVESQKLQEGQSRNDLQERGVLLQQIESLQAQNLELKRQLQASCAKTA